MKNKNWKKVLHRNLEDTKNRGSVVKKDQRSLNGRWLNSNRTEAELGNLFMIINDCIVPFADKDCRIR